MTDTTRTKLTTNEARQGERRKGLPSVLAISTVAVGSVFALMLIASIA